MLFRSEAAGRNSKLCIGGLSMGGYGALRLGGLYPQLFQAVSGHSSLTKLEQMTQFVEEPLSEYLPCPKPDIIDVLLANKSELPALRFDCGESDDLLAANRMLHEQLKEQGVQHQYEEFSGGHEWPYWQKHVEKTLRFFDLHV